MPTVQSKKICQQLVRDEVPEIISTLGYTPVTRVLDPKEYVQSLIDKIHEEAIDAALVINRPSKLTEELSDLQELIDTIAEYSLVSKDDIATVQTNKRRERGGFRQRIFLEEIIETGI